MTASDRTEVREMIQSTLEGWNKATVARESMTLVALEKIEIHLGKINGKVATHESFIVGFKAVEKKSSINWTRTFQILGALIAFSMLLIGYLNITHQNKSVKEQVDNLGVPVVTNSRGQMLMLPDSAKIKFLFNDSLNYTIKRIGK